jgi:hypothetical protein
MGAGERRNQGAAKESSQAGERPEEKAEDKKIRGEEVRRRSKVAFGHFFKRAKRTISSSLLRFFTSSLLFFKRGMSSRTIPRSWAKRRSIMFPYPYQGYVLSDPSLLKLSHILSFQTKNSEPPQNSAHVYVHRPEVQMKFSIFPFSISDFLLDYTIDTSPTSIR